MARGTAALGSAGAGSTAMPTTITTTQATARAMPHSMPRGRSRPAAIRCQRVSAASAGRRVTGAAGAAGGAGVVVAAPSASSVTSAGGVGGCSMSMMVMTPPRRPPSWHAPAAVGALSSALDDLSPRSDPRLGSQRPRRKRGPMPGFDNTADAERLPAGRQNGPGPGTAAPAAGGVHARLLLLQRLAGNRAVQSMLRPAPGAIVVQRDDVVPGQTDLGDLVDGVAEITEGVSFMDISDDGDGEGAGAVEGGGDAPGTRSASGVPPRPPSPRPARSARRRRSARSARSDRRCRRARPGSRPRARPGSGRPQARPGSGHPRPRRGGLKLRLRRRRRARARAARPPSARRPPSASRPSAPPRRARPPSAEPRHPARSGSRRRHRRRPRIRSDCPPHTPRFGEPSTLGWSSAPPPQSQTPFPTFGTGSAGPSRCTPSAPRRRVSGGRGGRCRRRTRTFPSSAASAAGPSPSSGSGPETSTTSPEPMAYPASSPPGPVAMSTSTSPRSRGTGPA